MAQDEKIEAEKAVVATAAKPAKKKGRRPKGSKNKPKRAPKMKGGSGKRYDAKVKTKILAAAKGKPLAEAYIAAVGAGYKGTAASLYQMLYNAGKKQGKRGRPKGSKNSPAVRRGPGRPPKAVTAAQLGGGLSQVEIIVAREVQIRLNSAARAAIAEMQKLIS